MSASFWRQYYLFVHGYGDNRVDATVSYYVHLPSDRPNTNRALSEESLVFGLHEVHNFRHCDHSPRASKTVLELIGAIRSSDSRRP